MLILENVLYDKKQKQFSKQKCGTRSKQTNETLNKCS